MNFDIKIYNNFLNFLRKNKCIIPEDFISKYYLITKDNFVAISDCISWLNVNRDNIIKTLRKTYKINLDYFEINYQEELNIVKIGQKFLNIKSNNKKFFKLTTDCFKKLVMSSNSKNGKMTKEYYIEMERIVKNFSNFELERLNNENKKLKNNINPIKISSNEGLYVWHYGNTKLYRIGHSSDMKKRIHTHNSSHDDNIYIDHEIITPCHTDLEKSVLIMLDSFRYRNNKDFFDCNLKIIKKAIYAEEDKRDDIINEYYYRGRNGSNDNSISSGNSKLLYKLRNNAIEANKKDDTARTKRITESVFENVNFNNFTIVYIKNSFYALSNIF
jgi:phage anti-repressor protein